VTVGAKTCSPRRSYAKLCPAEKKLKVVYLVSETEELAYFSTQPS